jgi:hypothetical protein
MTKKRSEKAKGLGERDDLGRQSYLGGQRSETGRGRVQLALVFHIAILVRKQKELVL